MKVSRRGVVSGSAMVLAAGGAGLPLKANAARAEASLIPADDPTAMPIPAHTIPVPKSISPEGQAFLAGAAQRINAKLAGKSEPEQAGGDDAMMQYFKSISDGFKGTAETIGLPGGGKMYKLSPEGRTGRTAEVAYVDIHGGGFVSGGGEVCKYSGMARALDYGVDVFSIDYRLLPDHPYPAGLDDCVDAYKQILKDHKAKDLVVGGASAGGNLVAAVMMRARAEGLPFPAALLLLTPALDMTRAGDSYQTNRYLDVVIGDGYRQGEPDPARGYGANADQTDPFVSPIFGDVSGWPPTLLSTGTRDLLLSDTVRMHRKLRRAGISAELHVTEAGPHGGFQGRAPEDREVLAECNRFAREAWGMNM